MKPFPTVLKYDNLGLWIRSIKRPRLFIHGGFGDKRLWQISLAPGGHTEAEVFNS
jgi:hypothetical protein